MSTPVSQPRKQMFVSRAIQGRLLARTTLYWLVYHAVLWIYAGLAGAYYGCARTHDPDWRLRFTLLDAVVVAVLCLGMIPAFSVYLRLKL